MSNQINNSIITNTQVNSQINNKLENIANIIGTNSNELSQKISCFNNMSIVYKETVLDEMLLKVGFDSSPTFKEKLLQEDPLMFVALVTFLEMGKSEEKIIDNYNEINELQDDMEEIAESMQSIIDDHAQNLEPDDSNTEDIRGEDWDTLNSHLDITGQTDIDPSAVSYSELMSIKEISDIKISGIESEITTLNEENNAILQTLVAMKDTIKNLLSSKNALMHW